MATMLPEVAELDSKRIRVSKQRQVTIPTQFYQQLGMGTEAECFVRDGEIVIRPLSHGGVSEFGTFILRDLIAQGLAGSELLAEFERVSAEVRPAALRMLAEAHQAAENMDTSRTPEEKSADLFAEMEE